MTEPSNDPEPRGTSALERVTRLVTDDSERAARNLLAGAFAVIVFLIVLIEAVGPVHFNKYGHDVFLLLDGGWRVVQGQRPHLDFYSPLGALPSLLSAFGIVAGGHTVGSILHGSALLAFVLGIWTVVLVRTRMSAFLGATAAVMVALTVLGTHPLGFDIKESDYAMLYNRYGFALLSIVWLEAFTEPKAPSRRTDLLGGLSTGVASALLFFLKLNFFGVAGLVGIARLAARPGRREWLMGAAAGFAAASLPFLVYLRFSVGAIIHDARIVSQARSGTLNAEKFVDVAGDNGWWIALVGLLAGAVIVVTPPAARTRRAMATVLGEAALLALAGVFAISTNWQWLEAPIFGIGALTLLERAGRAHAASPLGAERYVGALALAGVLGLRTIGHDALGIFSTSLDNIRDRGKTGERFELDSFSDYVVGTGGGLCPFQYGPKLREGLRLLEKVVNADTRLFVADFTNPYNFALKLRSPRGDATWWHYGYTYNADSPLGPEVVLKDVNLALVPRCPEDQLTGVKMSTSHIAWIEANFDQVQVGKYWVLYRRR